jgi:hypothetical protein
MHLSKTIRGSHLMLQLLEAENYNGQIIDYLRSLKGEQVLEKRLDQKELT